MFQTSQRYRPTAVTLARFVLLAIAGLVVAACTSGEVPSTSASPTTASTTDTPSTSTPSTTIPTTSAAPTTAAPTITPAPTTERPTLTGVADGLTGKIVIRTSAGELVVSAPDGSDAVMWSAAGEGFASQPTWSSDGTQLAWTVIGPDGPAVARGRLDEGPDSTVLLPVVAPPFYYSWSPGDDWLVGLRNGRSGVELTMLDVESGELRLIGPGQPFFTDWATDGDLVAAIGGIALADIPAAPGVDAAQRDITEPLGLFQAPIALDDGDVIVALRSGETNNVVRLQGSASTTLAVAPGPVAMSMDHAGQRLAVLVAPGDDEPEFISFENQTVAQTEPELDAGRVTIIDLATGATETRPETNILAVQWSPTGSTLAMLEASDGELTWLFVEPGRDAERSMAFTPTAEFANAYLPFADQYDRSSTWWSPDGAAFVFAGAATDASGDQGIWIDRLDDDQGPALLAEGDIAFWGR